MFNVKTLRAGHVYLNISYYFTFSVSTLVSFLSLFYWQQIIFTHNASPVQFLLPPLLPTPSLPFLLISIPALFPLQKWSLLQNRTKQEKTRYNMRRQKSSCGSWTRQLNRRKKSQEQAKESEAFLLPLLGSHNETPSYQPYHTFREPCV